MFSALMQDWVTLFGSGTTPLTQDRAHWLDLAGCGDVTFWLEVRAVANPGAGNLTLAYETSPSLDEAVFLPLSTLTLAASTTPVITRILLTSNPTVPLARFVRWTLSGTAAGNWSVTFRVHARATSGRAAGVFDIASLALTGWWRASYAGSPWTGTASAGSSNGRTLSEASNPPSTGASLNGFTPADFDGTNDKLASSLDLSSFVSATSGSLFVLFNADTAATDSAGAPYANPALLSIAGSGHVIVSFSTAGVVAAIYDSSYKIVSITCGTGAWHLAQVRWNGSTLDARVDGGDWSSVSSSGPSYLANVLQAGTNYAAAAFFDGRVAEIGSIDSALTTEQFDAIRGSLGARYSIAV